DAVHGDLGLLARDDVVILCSKTGGTQELTAMIPTLRRFGARLVALTAAPESELARAAGARHLVAGQVDDLLLSQTPAEAGVVEGIHRRKTAALFRAAVLGGGILGGAHAEACEGLRGFAEALGLAFQITDDLLDRDEDGACSLVRVIGAEAAGRRAEALLAEALAALEPFGERAEPLRELARYAVRRDR
ncbi:MAG: polyprenyl synthetase family protein, partial [Myxococcota bacterium]